MDVTIIRHTSVDVAQGICYGQSDVSLRESFEEEARIVASGLEMMDDVRSDMVYCSPLSRCRKLAAFCGFEEPLIDERLLEINFGDWEMEPFDAIKDPVINLWYEDWINVSPTNGESFKRMVERVDNFFKEKKDMGQSRITLFSHAGVIACTKVITGKCEMKDAFNELAHYGEIVNFVL